MKENVDKYLEDLTEKVIKDRSIESPSFNFTDKVMSQVNTVNESKTLVYKPLISKTTWVLIAIGFLAIMLYLLLFETQTEPSGWLHKINFGVLSSKEISFPSFKVSKTLMYAVVLFGVMFSIQIPFLKHHFDKRLKS